MAIFDEKFTNLYSLSKTLRFELKPVGETQQMLLDENVFQKDKLIRDKYQKTKRFFDKLHREFVGEALAGLDLDYKNYFDALKIFKKDKKDKDAIKNLENAEKSLRKSVVETFDATAKSWASEKYSDCDLKKKDIGIFFEENVFKMLEERYKNEDDVMIDVLEETEYGTEVKIGEQSIFAGWKNFTGYFTKFHETRKNFYKDEAKKGHGKAGQISTRIVDQNLRRFCENLEDFKKMEKMKDKIDFSEVENNFKKSLSEVFTLDFYNRCILQDGIDFYNDILGGKTLENGEKLKGVNELINHYRQNNKGEKLPFLKSLDKQILSEKDNLTFGIESDEKLLEVLSEFVNIADVKIDIIKNLFRDFIDNNSKYDLAETYMSKEAFNTISHKWTGDTDMFEKNVFEVFKVNKDKSAKYVKAEDKYNFPNFIPLKYIKDGLEKVDTTNKFWRERYYEDTNDNTNNGFLTLGANEVWKEFLSIFDYEFSSLFSKTIKKGSDDEKIIGFDFAGKDLKKLLNDDNFALNKGEKLNPEEKIIIKDFADNFLRIYQMAKYFALEKDRKWNPDGLELGDFYTNSKFGYESFYLDAYEKVVKVYNDLRNYLTKKPWEDAQKWKLNFENASLAGGWDKNKEDSSLTVILRKEGQYFLGLMKKGCNHLFDDRHSMEFSQHCEDGKYEKMVYKYLPDAAKMIPKGSTQLKSVKEHFSTNDESFTVDTKAFIEPLTISKRVFNLNNVLYDKSDISKTTSDKGGVKQFQKDYLRLSEDFSTYKSALNDWIDFCKDFLSKYKSTINFDLSTLRKTKDYESLDQFYKDIDKISYKISFQDISEEYVNKCNKEGKLYLFQINNKDWNKGSTGTKNLHTLYFENIFSDENVARNFIIKLNGQAELFHRPKISEENLGYRKDNNGKTVIQHKRYNENKTFLHLPLTLNRGKGDPFAFNDTVNEFLANNPDINIIGIDRGEKHLAYYSVINQKGEILEGNTLNRIEKLDHDKQAILSNEKEIVEKRDNKNEIIDYKLKETGKKVRYIDYKLLLDYKEKKRRIERQSWQTIEGIKDLKKGYISQVVHKLANLAIKYNAIIVFEDLNMRFKQVRGGIEKSVYQQLEKALIEKFNFLVDKGETNSEKAGHLLKAYQLAGPEKNFKDIGKQTGIIFYTTASYTSKIDPVSGWRPNLYLKSGNAEVNKANILKFSRIEFRKGRFEFTYDTKNFILNAKAYPQKTEWTVCSCVERYKWNRKANNNKGGYDHYKNLTVEFEKIFKDAGIDISGDLLGEIERLETKGNEKFFSDFIFLFRLVCQIRNTNNSDKAKKDGKDDFILSPVEPFFDSRKNNGKDLPKNGDDNGAFNIARKGLIMLKRVDEWAKDEKKKYPDLFVGNVDWDNFCTEKKCSKK